MTTSPSGTKYTFTAICLRQQNTALLRGLFVFT
nr:MAG TPA: hypothetical protein [Inoviridae sp.]